MFPSHATAPGVQVTQIGILMGRERLWTRESQPMTRALIRTNQVTQQFIVRPWALGDPVTDMARVQTRLRIPTAIMTRTQVAGAVQLILVTWTVVETVTSGKDGQTVSVPWALIVGVRTNRRTGSVMCVMDWCNRSAPILRNLNDCRRGRWFR